MKLHKALNRPNAFGGTTYRTLCGRTNRQSTDGMNVADRDADVTCKFCLTAMRRDPTALLAMPVTNRTEAEAFIRALHEAGLGYHFDDGAYDSLFGNHLVSAYEAGRIDGKVAACYVAWNATGPDDCPIGYLLQCEGS